MYIGRQSHIRTTLYSSSSSSSSLEVVSKTPPNLSSKACLAFFNAASFFASCFLLKSAISFLSSVLPPCIILYFKSPSNIALSQFFSINSSSVIPILPPILLRKYSRFAQARAPSSISFFLRSANSFSAFPSLVLLVHRVLLGGVLVLLDLGFH